MSNGAHRPPIDDLWYKNAIIYCLDVEKYVDSDGDGIGDFGGLTRKLDYLAGLGVTCDRLQMMLNFPVNQRLFYALATGDIRPLVRALEATYHRPQAAQWVNFLRSHDELDLGRLTKA